MNIFRTIVSRTPRIRRHLEEPALESRPDPARQAQREPSPPDDGLTKAEEMLRFMAERRKRFKKL